MTKPVSKNSIDFTALKELFEQIVSKLREWIPGQEKQVIPPIYVTIVEGDSLKSNYKFTDNFIIGREEDECAISFRDYSVSREHVEVYYESECWHLRDLNSSNGTFIDGEKIDSFSITDETYIRLGEDGPVLSFSLRMPDGVKADVQSGLSVDDYVDYYFATTSDQPAGEKTTFIRDAYQKIQKKQRWQHLKVLSVLFVLLVIAGAYAFYKHKEVQKHRDSALDIFYAMKSIELEISKIEQRLYASNDLESLHEVDMLRASQAQMRANYNEFIDELNIYNKDLTEIDKLILKVANVFGECELNMPDGFVKEVKRYIKKWQSTNRYEKAIRLARQKKYTLPIAEAMINKNLPPQFFYLALQESDFNHNTCGPRTRFGIAKGMWQFIPATARRYGLEIGPLARYRRPDTRDDRHSFEKSTKAAADYLYDIYNTEAQASALLVMASYNWGERRVNELINQMPENPRERNFWKLLEKYRNKIPNQTYDYVFYIFSAAVIGENPRLFGFDFDNPLREAEEVFGG